MKKLLICLLAAASARAYVHSTDSSGVSLHRTDVTGIQFLLGDNVAPGLVNASGKVWITADSDPIGAVTKAMQTWSSVATAGIVFLPAQKTPITVTSLDGPNLILFADTPENDKLSNGAIAVTHWLRTDNTISHAGIVFSSHYQFSTTKVPDTFDLQSILTHELGHALGANHSGIIGATMFQFGVKSNNFQASLKDDDVAFAVETYGGNAGNGTIAGSIKFSAGGVLRGALVQAIDSDTGVAVSGFSNLLDGTFSFGVPPGNYTVYAEPLGAIVAVSNLYLDAASVDTNFETTVLGGLDQPTRLAVAAGQTVQAIFVTPASVQTIKMEYAGALTGGLYTGPTFVPAGRPFDLVFLGPGLSTVHDGNVHVLGAATLHPGSVFSTKIQGQEFLALSLDSATRTTTALASVIVSAGGHSAAYSGGLVMMPAAPLTMADGVTGPFTFRPGPVAPGEIVSIFGDALSSAATKAGDVQVTFDGIAGPVFFVSPGQVNVEVPFEVAGHATTTMVVSNGALVGDPLTLTVAAAAPDVLKFAINPDGTRNTATNPALRGTYVLMFATGLGVLNPAVKTGEVPGASNAANISVTANSVPRYDMLTYAGSAAGFTGLDQLNLVLPVGMDPGEYSMQFLATGVSSNSVNIWVQ